MRIVVPIILFVAVAGFHSVTSASLESAESNESSEETVSEVHTTTQKPDELGYEAVHVKDEESVGVNHTDQEHDEKSEGAEVLDEEDTDDGEKEALTGTTDTQEENASSSDESVETHSEGAAFKQTTVTEQVEERVESVEELPGEIGYNDHD